MVAWRKEGAFQNIPLFLCIPIICLDPCLSLPVSASDVSIFLSLPFLSCSGSNREREREQTLSRTRATMSAILATGSGMGKKNCLQTSLHDRHHAPPPRNKTISDKREREREREDSVLDFIFRASSSEDIVQNFYSSSLLHSYARFSFPLSQ